MRKSKICPAFAQTAHAMGRDRDVDGNTKHFRMHDERTQ